MDVGLVAHCGGAEPGTQALLFIQNYSNTAYEHLFIASKGKNILP